MALRMQKERQQDSYLPSIAEYVREFCITPEGLKLARPGALVMHPGPTNRGVEIAAEVLVLGHDLLHVLALHVLLKLGHVEAGVLGDLHDRIVGELALVAHEGDMQIGRASCRERV